MPSIRDMAAFAGDEASPFDAYRAPLERAAQLAIEHLEGVPERHVGADPAAGAQVSDELGRLPEDPLDPTDVVERLAASVDRGLTAMNSPRFFGFVIGGTLPAALAADWLTSAWDQNAALHVPTPAAAAVEAIAARWLTDLFGLPAETAVGFVTGATVANLTCLAAARHEILRRERWNVEADGLQGAPRISVVTGAEAHPSMLKALRLLGLGQSTALRVAVDEQGRIRADDLARVVATTSGPTIVAVQAGNVNTGSFDPIAEILPVVRRHPNAWLHVDGAFGLWAAASPRLRPLIDGIEGVDSAATDAHKWLNTPYDCGLAFVRNEAALRAAMSVSAAYLPASPLERDPSEYVPELSRRARGFTVYAALASLGRRGIARLVERCSDLAALIAERLAADPSVQILNDVVLNQVLVRFSDSDDLTREVIRRVQADGVLWAGPTTWQGKAAMRISVSGWSTREDDVLRSVESILRAARAVHPAAGA